MCVDHGKYLGEITPLMIAIKVRFTGYNRRCNRILPSAQIHREAATHLDLLPSIDGTYGIAGVEGVDTVNILPKPVADGVTENQFLQRLSGLDGGGKGHSISGSDDINIGALISPTQDEACY